MVPAESSSVGRSFSSGDRGVGLRLAIVATIVSTIGCDRVTKHIATATLAGTSDRIYLADTVRLTYAENTGGFLSLGAALPPVARTALFTIGTAALLIVAVVFALRVRTRWAQFGFALFFAGGVSNWIDRLVSGSVVDFMNVGVGSFRTGIFNVADVSILAGIGIFLLAEIFVGTNAGACPDSDPT